MTLKGEGVQIIKDRNICNYNYNVKTNDNKLKCFLGDLKLSKKVQFKKNSSDKYVQNEAKRPKENILYFLLLL